MTSMIHLLRSTSLLTVALWFTAMLVSQPAVAASNLAIAPSEAEVMVVSDAETEQTVTIARQNADERLVLSVQPDIDPSVPVRLEGDEILVMEQGETEKNYTYRVVALGVSPGQYQMEMRFVPQAGTDASSDGINIVFAIGQKISVQVVATAEEIIHVTDASTLGELTGTVEFSDIHDANRLYGLGELATVSWTVRNVSAAPVSNVPYTVVVQRNGEETSRFSGSLSGTIEPGGEATASHEEALAESGKYTVIVESALHRSEVTFWAFDYQESFLVVAFGLLAAVLTVALGSLYRERKIRSWAFRRIGLIITAGSTVIALLLALVVTLFFFTVPKPVPAETVQTDIPGVRSFVLLREWNEAREQKTHFARLTDGMLDEVTGRWDFHAVADDHFFAIPASSAEWPEVEEFYLVYPNVIIPYKTANLPGPAKAIRENGAASYFAVVGDSYLCTSVVQVTDGPDCTYANELLPPEYSVVDAFWPEGEDQFLTIQAEREVADGQRATKFFSYDAWNNTIKEGVQDLTGASTIAEPENLIMRDDSDRRLLGTVVHFADSETSYRVPKDTRFIRLAESLYLMVSSTEAGTEISMFNANSGNYHSVYTAPESVEIYYLEKGSRITSPVM